MGIGIDTSNTVVGAKLHVLSSSFPQVRINNETSGGESGIRMRSFTDSSNQVHGDIFVDSTGGSEGGFMAFRMPYTAERFRIKSDGSIGFGGQTNPIYPLDGSRLRLKFDTNTNHLVIQNTATATSGSFEKKIAFFGYNDNEEAAVIGLGNQYFGSPANALIFKVSTTEHMRIKHGGAILLNSNTEIANRKLRSEGGYSLEGGGYNTSYTSDGLYGGSATPNILSASTGQQLRLGYLDNGSGLYSTAYVFETKSTDGLSNTVEKEALIVKNTNSGNWVSHITNLGTGYFTKLGVNTTSPSSQLHVYGTGTVARLQSNSTYVDMLLSSSGNTGFLNLDSNGMNFYVNGGSSSNLHMRITNSGNVGIEF